MNLEFCKKWAKMPTHKMGPSPKIQSFGCTTGVVKSCVKCLGWASFFLNSMQKVQGLNQEKQIQTTVSQFLHHATWPSSELSVVISLKHWTHMISLGRRECMKIRCFKPNLWNQIPSSSLTSGTRFKHNPQKFFFEKTLAKKVWTVAKSDLVGHLPPKKKSPHWHSCGLLQKDEPTTVPPAKLTKPTQTTVRFENLSNLGWILWKCVFRLY